MGNIGKYQKIGIITIILLLVSNCLKPVLPWEIAESYSEMHKILFFSQWAGFIGVCSYIGLYWKEYEKKWKNLFEFMCPTILLYAITQITVFAITFSLGINSDRLSFLKANLYTGYISVVIGGTLLIFVMDKMKNKIGIIFPITIFIVLGIISGIYPQVGSYYYLERLVLGSSIILFSCFFEPNQVKYRYVVGSILLLASTCFIVCFDLIGARGYVGLITEMQLNYETMYLTIEQGMIGRSVWYLISFLLSMGLLCTINEKPCFIKSGKYVPFEYAVQGICLSVVLNYNTIEYKQLGNKVGNYVYLIVATFVFLISVNPISLKIYSKVSSVFNKIKQTYFNYDLLSVHIGEKNSYKKLERRVLCITVATVFSYTFFVFGPYESFIYNTNYLVSNFSQFWFPMLVFGLIIGILFFILFCFVKGKLGDYLISLVFAIALCGYLQGNYMNINLGDLNGASICWSDYYQESIINTIVWICIVGSVFALYHFTKKGWKKFIRYASMMMIAMQFIAMITMFMTMDLTDKNKGYFSFEEGFDMASKENIVVFVLDMMDNDYVHEILSEKADFFNRLEGFTYYENCTSRYQRTFPSVTYMLTNTPYFYDEEVNDYFTRAWKNAPYIHQLLKDGYNIQIMGNMKYTAGTGEPLEGIVSNYKSDKGKASYVNLPIMMLKLQCYRSMPHVLKRFFWLYTEDINGVFNDRYILNDKRFYEILKKDRLKIGESEKQFIFYHLNGSHGPYLLDENMNKVSQGTDEIQQTKGCMKIVFEYLEQMKELGIYDNATIIITADHGNLLGTDLTNDTLTPAFMMKMPGDNGSFSFSDVPVINSDFWATIFQDDVTENGEMNILDLRKDTERERLIYRVLNTDEQIYSVGQNAENLEDWTLLEQNVITHDIFLDK